LDPKRSSKKDPQEVFHDIDFKIEGTRFFKGESIIGWRITVTDKTTDHEHEFWFQDGNICLVDFRTAKPWTHRTPFIVGRPVKRIRRDEQEAILKAFANWQESEVKFPPQTESKPRFGEE
jgi:hypothetical protein